VKEHIGRAVRTLMQGDTRYKTILGLWFAIGVTLCGYLVYPYSWVDWLAVMFAALAFLLAAYPTASSVWKEVKKRYLQHNTEERRWRHIAEAIARKLKEKEEQNS
jgi:hypothetical protein